MDLAQPSTQADLASYEHGARLRDSSKPPKAAAIVKTVPRTHPQPRPEPLPVPCACGGRTVALGRCRACYTAAFGWVCADAQCQKPAHSSWGKIVPLCMNHYQRMRYRGTTLPRPPKPPKPPRPEPVECAVVNCKLKAKYQGFCANHKHRRGQDDPTRPSKWRSKVGEPTIVGGYVMVVSPGARRSNGRIQEHRLVMEEHLGRELRDFENVHHKNGVRHDNRIENLELWVVPQPSGQRAEDLVEWVIEHYAEAIDERRGA